MHELEDGAAPTKETFTVGGEAPNVLDADEQAWRALESCLGRDPVKAWRLSEMNHVYRERGQIEWAAEFVRDPDVPVPPLEVEAAEQEAS